jgi:phage terminase large subunit-like protein
LNVDRLIIESKAAGISVAQTIKRLYKTKSWGVVMVDPKGRDKEARAHAVTDLFADKMIYAPDREWAQMVIDQAAQ